MADLADLILDPVENDSQKSKVNQVLNMISIESNNMITQTYSVIILTGKSNQYKFWQNTEVLPLNNATKIARHLTSLSKK